VFPKTHTKEQIGEKIVLEQFLRMVNADVQLWVREHNPSIAQEALLLADSFITARWEGINNPAHLHGVSLRVVRQVVKAGRMVVTPGTWLQQLAILVP